MKAEGNEKGRRTTRRSLAVGFCLLGLHAILASWLMVQRRGVGRVVPGVDLPLDTLLQRKVASLTTHQTHPRMVMREHQATLVLLFASWCAPCRAEIAAVRSLPEEERKKLGVIGLCLDENQDDAVAFVRDTDPDFPVFLAREGVLRTLGVRSIPLTILVDSNGTILDASVGLDEHFLEKVRTWIPSSP